MNNAVALVFFSMIGLFCWLVYKYVAAITSTVNIANNFGVNLGSLQSDSPQLSRYVLMSDITFAIELIRGSYQSMGYPIELIRSLDRARTYMLWQIPTVITGFLTPVIIARI